MAETEQLTLVVVAEVEVITLHQITNLEVADLV
jgi:hypothetical protein